MLLGFLLPLSATAAQNVTIVGKDFYLDGKPWLPKGIDVEAFNRLLGNYESASLQASARQLRQYWGPAELQAIMTVFGAQAIRLTISQPGLDPQSAGQLSQQIMIMIGETCATHHERVTLRNG